MDKKRLIALLSLAVILIAGIYSMIYTFQNASLTYDGSNTNVVDLIKDPSSYDVSSPNGIADVIVSTNLEQTMAANNVAAVVFDFRGFDTIGESFILLTAIAGSYVILSRGHSHGKGLRRTGHHLGAVR